MLQCLYRIVWRIFLILNTVPLLLVRDCLFTFVVDANDLIAYNNITDSTVKFDYNISGAMVLQNHSNKLRNNKEINFTSIEEIHAKEKKYARPYTDEPLGNSGNNVVKDSRNINMQNYAYSSKVYAQSKVKSGMAGHNKTASPQFLIAGNKHQLLIESKTGEDFVDFNNNCTISMLNSEDVDTQCAPTQLTPLYIGGLFDLSGSRGEALGRSELTAAILAIDHVNRRKLLPGYQLYLLHNDTRCDPGVGMDALFDLIYRQPQLLMVIGSACSEVTKTLAEIVPYWNLILVSFASTSPALSEREKYKTFFRLAPADSSQNGPRAMFIHEFGWDTVAALYEIEGDYSLAVDEMGNTFEQNNITIKISTSFRRYEDIATNLVAIKEHDVRIIIGGYSERAARTVLCQAYNLSMYGPRYVWIMIGDYVEKWWEVSNDTTCTKSQLREAAEGYFTIDSLNSLGDDDMSSVNISVRQFMEDYDGKEGPRPMSPYATSTYDTVWTIALTLQQVMEHAPASLFDDEHPVLEQFTYQSGQEVRKLFLDAMQGLDFLGISGPISFEGPDRKGVSVISQNQRGKMTRIALYEPDGAKLNFFCRTCQPIIWLGGRAPRDKIVLVSRKKTIHSVAFLCVSSASVCGLILASGFLAYNLYHRSLRYIKLSSPKLNNVAVIGCMLVYAGIIVLGCDDTMLDELYYPYLCTARAFLFAAGFSLSFGAMFTKTYRVHQIFTRANRGLIKSKARAFLFAAGFSLSFGAMFTKTYHVHQIFTRANRGLIKSKLLRDKQLLFIVGALLVVDSVVLIIWGFVDPMYKQITNLTMEVAENDQDLLYISQLTKCHSHHIDQWTGTLYAYKGLLLVFGVYMAWETRHVKIPALNDSRYIGMNVYNVVIMSVLVVTISNILSHQPTLAYVMESSFMLLSTTMTLCLLFVPKIYAIMTYKGEPVIAASGITVEAKCRRFAVDERREHFYRAEVQNRVYKREIVELDEEIVRLERLMELPVQPYPKLTKQLLCLLPESRVDPSPAIKRRWVQERDMCCSISDAGDICMGLSEDKSDDGHEYAEECSRPAQKPIRRRANRLSIRVATNYAYTKLCKLRPRFSVGSVNYKHDYEDLKGSPTSPDGFLSPVLPIGRSRSSHPFMRQEAVEENRRVELTTDSKQDSEKSETRTFETHISEDVDSEIAQDYSSVTFHVPSAIRDHLKVSCHVDRTGCEDTKSSDNVHAPMRRRRKYGNTLEIPVQYDECKISEADTPATEHSAPRIRRARSILEHERRTRIKKLQSDLRRIQKELQDLDELEYEVSVV